VRMTGTVMDINDRKLAEERILRSEERYRSLVTASFQIVWTTDEFGNGTSLSTSWFDLIGKSWDEFQPWGWADYLHPDDRDRTIQAWTNAVVRRTAYETEYRLRAKDGNYRDFSVRGVPVLNPNGSIREWVGTCSDITDRKQAEVALQKVNEELELRVQQRTAELSQANELLHREQEALRDSEERFRSAFDYASIGIALVGLDGRWLQVNSSLCEIVGYSEQELMALTFQDITHPDDLQTDLNYVQQLIRGEISSYEMEKRYVHKQGHEVWVLLSVSLVHDRNTQPLYFIAQIQDISDAYRQATQRKLAEEALRKSEERWQLAIRGSNDGIWDWNVRTNEVFFSSRWKEMLGFEDHEISNHLDEWAKRVHPDDLGWVTQVIQDHFAKKTPFYVSEHRVLCKDGIYKWILDRGQALWDEAGNVVRMAGSHTDITERKQIQEALQRSESTLRSFFDSAPMMMGIVKLLDDDILHISDNAATAKLFGLTPETMQNKRASEMGVPQAFLRMWIERYREAERTQSPVRFEYIHESDQGQRWLSATVSSIALSPRKRQRFSYVVEDISDRKFAEEERAKLINILEAASDFVASASVNQQVRYLNSAARKLFGFSQDADLTNFSISDAHPNWALEIVQNQGIPAAVNDGVWLGENAFLNHDGREIPISQLIIAHKGADGRVKHFSTIARDIAQQKQVEATLREAERRWRSLLENVHLLVVGLDITGKVEFANAFFLEVTGYTQAEVLGKNWFETFLPLQEQQQVHTAFQEILEHEFHPHYTNTILTKSGEERIIAWNNTLLQNLQGEVIGTMSIGEDITERHAIEKMKNEFVSIVSHELRTPLTSIRGSLGMLATGALNSHPERMRRMIEIAAIDTERLVRLVNDILDLERLDSGRVTLVKECCDAAALMVQAAEAMRSLAEKDNITLSVSPLSTLVWASPDHIIQTLTNLLSNAIKFSPANSTITLKTEHQGDRVLFQVKDQGRGIPADKLDTIFGRFQQVDASDSRSKGGTGLGLAICHSIITQHGGRIWVESVLGEGSTFYFTLPVSPEPA
ncbi:MAG: PAS domain S-box protein, partial [Coleofasciculus sp. S288]|nr:PAS domain S-box protein [Coleofasciculus sp. S288]